MVLQRDRSESIVIKKVGQDKYLADFFYVSKQAYSADTTSNFTLCFTSL